MCIRKLFELQMYEKVTIFLCLPSRLKLPKLLAENDSQWTWPAVAENSTCYYSQLLNENTC